VSEVNKFYLSFVSTECFRM